VRTDESVEENTVCHPVIDGELLLIRKQRGLGAGKIVAPGGGVEPGETPRAGAIREVEEELCVTPTGVEKVGEIDFHFRDPSEDDDSLFVHVFVADGIEGTPEETPEAVPRWAPADDPPYEEMWVDDRIWLPHLLDGRTFTSRFVLSDDGESLVEYDVSLDVAFGD
jgi:8-oxo-dGTP diphosphatase